MGYCSIRSRFRVAQRRYGPRNTIPAMPCRDVPEDVRDELAARAARARKSMQEYLKGELERLASRPSVDVWLERVRERKAAAGTRVSAAEILKHRDAGRK